MRNRKPNLTTKQLLEAVATSTYKGTGDIAATLGYRPDSVLVKLKVLESKGSVKCEMVNKRMFVWSLIDECFGSFNGRAARCKACLGAVECHGVSVE